MDKLVFNNFNIWLHEHFDSAKVMEACVNASSAFTCYVPGHKLSP